MKKFTDNKITNQPNKKTIPIESLVNDNLQVKVEGGIDKFLEKYGDKNEVYFKARFARHKSQCNLNNSKPPKR